MTQITKVFLELVKAGLWEKETDISQNSEIDFGKVFLLAQEQSVVGLLAAGLERINVQSSRFKVPQALALTIAGDVLQLEQRNKTMNQFIARLVSDMRNAGIYTLLVKGQGGAQCYEKPLWRACGDVDFFLSDENYVKAKEFLIPRASSVEPEGVYGKHLGMTIDGWVVELHGRLRCGFSGRADKVLDEIQNETFYGGSVSSWSNNGVQVFKLSKENEVFYVFVHFLGHFYKGGIGLRQICDWCRLLYTYRESLNYGLLESRIRKAGLVSEWKAFYCLATKYLGMPDLVNGSGLMVNDSQFDKKADRIMEFILEVGNFGHKRDMSHFSKYPYLIRKCVSMGRRISDLINHTRIFPMDSLRFFPRIMFNGVRSAIRGE